MNKCLIYLLLALFFYLLSIILIYSNYVKTQSTSISSLINKNNKYLLLFFMILMNIFIIKYEYIIRPNNLSIYNLLLLIFGILGLIIFNDELTFLHIFFTILTFINIIFYMLINSIRLNHNFLFIIFISQTLISIILSILFFFKNIKIKI